MNRLSKVYYIKKVRYKVSSDLKIEKKLIRNKLISIKSQIRNKIY